MAAFLNWNINLIIDTKDVSNSILHTATNKLTSKKLILNQYF